MGIFDSNDLRARRQLDIYAKQIEVKKEQLDQLDGVDHPKAGEERERLEGEIAELEIKVEEIQAMREGEQPGRSPSIFDD
jgi:transposase